MCATRSGTPKTPNKCELKQDQGRLSSWHIERWSLFSIKSNMAMGNSNPLQESHSIYTVDRMIIRLMVSSIVRFQPGLFCYNPYSVTHIVQGVWNHQAVFWKLNDDFLSSEPPDVAWRTDGRDDDPKQKYRWSSQKIWLFAGHFVYSTPSLWVHTSQFIKDHDRSIWISFGYMKFT